MQDCSSRDGQSFIAQDKISIDQAKGLSEHEKLFALALEAEALNYFIFFYKLCVSVSKVSSEVGFLSFFCDHVM